MIGTSLRVVVAHRPPFVFVANGTGSALYYGLLVDILNKIIATSNTTLTYSIYVSPTNAGGSLGPLGWSGIVGELAKGRADVALFPLTRTAARLTAIDCSFSYLDQGIGLAVLDSDTAPGPLSVLAPFKTTLWITLLCTVIGVALVFWGLDTCGKWMRKKQIAAFREAGSITAKEAARAVKQKDDRSAVLISFMAAAGAPERPQRSNWGVQVLYVVYCFFCLIVLSSYTANLTSFLSIQKSTVGFTGLQDLVDKKALLAVIPNGSNAAYFTNSQDPLARRLRDSVRFCDTDTCLRWLRQGLVSAFASDQPQLVYLAHQQPCDLAVVGDPFGPGNLVFGLQKGSPLTPLFNDALQRFAEDGTLSSLRRAWFAGLSQCDGPDTRLENSKLGINQMLGAFVLLAAGVVVAFAIGTVENLKWRLAKAYQRSYGDMRARDGRLRPGAGCEGSSRPLPPGFDSKWRAATFRLLGVVGRYASGSPQTSAGGAPPPPPLAAAPPLGGAASAAADAPAHAAVVEASPHCRLRPSSAQRELAPVSLPMGKEDPSTGGGAAAVAAAAAAATAAAAVMPPLTATPPLAAGFKGPAAKRGPGGATVFRAIDLSRLSGDVSFTSPVPTEARTLTPPAPPSQTLSEPHGTGVHGVAATAPYDGVVVSSPVVPLPLALEEGAAAVDGRSPLLSGASMLLPAPQSWMQPGTVVVATAAAAAGGGGVLVVEDGGGSGGGGGDGGGGGGRQQGVVARVGAQQTWLRSPGQAAPTAAVEMPARAASMPPRPPPAPLLPKYYS